MRAYKFIYTCITMELHNTKGANNRHTSSCQFWHTIMLYLLFSVLLASAVSGFTPVVYPTKVSSECVHDDPLQDEQLMEAIRQAHQRLGPPGCNPPRNRSCQEIIYCFPSASSGYYQIHAPNGSLLQVYCDMEGTNCGNMYRLDTSGLSQHDPT